MPRTTNFAILWHFENTPSTLLYYGISHGMYSTVLYCTVLYSLYSTVQYCSATVLCTVLYCILYSCTHALYTVPRETYRRERATGSMVRTLSTKWCPSKIPPIIVVLISKLTPPVPIPFRGVRRPALLAAETATFPCVKVRPFSTHPQE